MSASWFERYHTSASRGTPIPLSGSYGLGNPTRAVAQPKHGSLWMREYPRLLDSCWFADIKKNLHITRTHHKEEVNPLCPANLPTIACSLAHLDTPLYLILPLFGTQVSHHTRNGANSLPSRWVTSIIGVSLGRASRSDV